MPRSGSDGARAVRRYSRDDLTAKLEGAGLAVEHLSYFNMLGVPGWYLNSRVLKRQSVPGVQARINDWLVPWLRVERRFGPPVGMSLLAVARALSRVSVAPIFADPLRLLDARR